MQPDSTVTRVDDVDLTELELWRHGVPHLLFTLLRRDAPVWRHPDTPGTELIGGGFWVISRHGDLQAVARDHQRFRSFEGPFLYDDPAQQGMQMISTDPPRHTRLRRLISAGFTPRMTAALDGQAREWAATIIDAALDRGECDFVSEVAYRLPMNMIGDIVGIPQADRAWLFDKVDISLRATDPRSSLTEEERTAILTELFEYAHQLGEDKRRSPADDVWTKLTTAQIEEPDGSQTSLNELELDLFFIILTFAGSETTRGAIAAGLLALLHNPGQMNLLRNDTSLMPNAVEEILRWSTPVTYFRRTAVETVELNGARIAAGDKVMQCYASANRDEDVFEDPFRFDVTRSPNPHVSLGGGGVHYCLGANLAKREIQVLFEELFARVADIEMSGEPEYSAHGIQNPITVTLKELPVRLSPR